ncbi:alanine dehydrogenase [Nitrosococcus watsonii]|uniref:alanine dehydrogenase n=1 Tax=Nitrosococcus watsoni (strain C-113) TaxID=105559 RepID=D8KAU6_NITWC|nr:alanine dehydrogenase [Nitrosococcus watsonii]ADJ29523.1 alanine dehydrogenase [Nitrosococcus watsonii C-113]
MRIGIPREIKTLEGRVALVPEATAELVQQGHEVFIERAAGDPSGYPDDAYQAAGVTLLPDARSLYDTVELIVKVKEPIGPELDLLRADHLLFSFLHLAAEPKLAQCLVEIGLTAVAFETVAVGDELPLLIPMSDIAGRLSIQIGATLLHRSQGGKGLLLGGLPGVSRGRVVILGAGTAGRSAVAVAAALGSEVIVFERRRDRLAQMYHLGQNVTALYPYQERLKEAIAGADLLIGAVLQAGARTPRLVSAEMVRGMRPGSIVVDISVDQGGCVETTRPTTYIEPTYIWEEVVPFAVTNMPGAVPRSASQALSSALLPYVLILSRKGWNNHPALAAGINIKAGAVVHAAVRESLTASA